MSHDHDEPCDAHLDPEWQRTRRELHDAIEAHQKVIDVLHGSDPNEGVLVHWVLVTANSSLDANGMEGNRTWMLSTSMPEWMQRGLLADGLDQL